MRFKIQNFRSLAHADLEIKPITVLTGANGAGKSSFMYSIMTLKNILSNANQPTDKLFQWLPFINLGGVKEVVTGKDANKPIVLSCYYSDYAIESAYTAIIGPQSSLRFTVTKPYEVDLKLDVSFPYPLVQNVSQEILWKNRKYKFVFNGIDVSVLRDDGKAASSDIDVLQVVNAVAQSLPRTFEYVDVRRGFFSNTYSLAIPSDSEQEAAFLLGSDRDLEGRVSVTLEKLTNRSFSTRQVALGAGSFYLQTTDRKTGFVCDLVNEGFGLNQLVYLLAKVLRNDVVWFGIEEPENHLHPEALTKLAEQLVSVAKLKQKRFLIASHSEHFVASLLNLVAQGRATVDDVAIHFVAKDENNLTKIAEQKINEKGQIEGGLRSFYEPGIRALEDFLGPQRDSEHVNPA